jgi:hypothetical protein
LLVDIVRDGRRGIAFIKHILRHFHVPGEVLRRCIVWAPGEIENVLQRRLERFSRRVEALCNE